MADTKITGLTNFDSSNTPYWPPAPASDVIPIVDVSDTTMAGSGTTKKISINNLLSSSPTATGALTVTGLVTAGSATITGAATVGTTLGVTGVSTFAADLILGQSSSALQSGGTGITIFGTSASEIKFLNSTTGTTATDGTALVTGGNNFSINNRESGTITLGTANTNRLVIEAAGDVTISTGNVVMATSGKGIDFSATASGSGTMTSELLNDYEEGTWTIGLVFSGGSTGITTSANTGRYTKIGRQVTVTGNLSLTSKGSSTGSASITGLPFTIANTDAAYSAPSIRFNAITYVGAFQSIGNINGTSFNLEQISTLGSVTAITDANFSNSSGVVFSFTYTV
jgi:hypothetical protein